MKQRFIVAALVFSMIIALSMMHILPPVEMRDTSVSGILPYDVLWSGTILVEGDVLVPSFFTLRTKPGTRVVFQVQDSTKSGSAVRNEFASNMSDPTATDEYEQTHASLTARVVANGTTFTSGARKPGYADWSSLNLLDGSRLDGCLVEYNRGGIVVLGNVSISGTEVHHSLWNCIETRGPLELSNSTVHHCWHNCILLAGENTSVRENEIRECYIGIQFMNVSAVVRNNAIGGICKLFYGPRGGVDMGNNEVNLAEPDSFGGTYQDRIIYPACD